MASKSESPVVKVNDVFRDTQGRLWTVREIQSETALLVDPYGLYVPRRVPINFVQQHYTFCWNAVEEGWAGA